MLLGVVVEDLPDELAAVRGGRVEDHRCSLSTFLSCHAVPRIVHRGRRALDPSCRHSSLMILIRPDLILRRFQSSSLIRKILILIVTAATSLLAEISALGEKARSRGCVWHMKWSGHACLLLIKTAEFEGALSSIPEELGKLLRHVLGRAKVDL